MQYQIYNSNNPDNVGLKNCIFSSDRHFKCFAYDTPCGGISVIFYGVSLHVMTPLITFFDIGQITFVVQSLSRTSHN